jgi:hypothetical protein
MSEDSNAVAGDYQQPESAGEAESWAPGREAGNAGLLTPAKRAGLAALEREFRDLLKKRRA